MEMRATFECDKLQGGSAIANHNDRSFLIENAENIDPTKTPENKVFVVLDKEDGSGRYLKALPQQQGALQQYELEYYKQTFGERIEQQKDRYLKNRQVSRANNCTIENYYESSQTGLMRMILQVGKEGNYKDKEKFYKMGKSMAAGLECVSEDGNARIRCVSLVFHFDETTIHAHASFSFEVKDKYGCWSVNQEECLKKLGYEKPRAKDKEGRYNNRKQVWTEKMRSKWYDTIERIDPSVSINRTPSPTNKLTKGKVQKIIYELKELIPLISSLKAELANLRENAMNLSKDEFQRRNETIMDTLDRLERVFGQKVAQVEPYLPKEEHIDLTEETIDDIEL